MTDVDIFINILKEKFPNYYFQLNEIYNDVLMVFGVKDGEVSSFCQNLCDCMCNPVNRIVFIEPLVNKLGYA
jgi:hypothetical protein